MTREEMRQRGYSPTAIAMHFGGPVGTDDYYKVMREEGADLSGECPHCGEPCFGTGDCDCMEVGRMKNPCEDYGYEMQRQERIDTMEAGMPRKQKQLISADMIGSDRLPQKYERTDPWRNIPWAHYGPQPISFGEKVGYALIWLGVLAAIVLPEVMK